jgi:predicted negative regulator of RcsB-dependent stress response
MPETISTLAATNEPTDEQLKKVMTDALSEVLLNKKKGDETLKKQANTYLIQMANKYKHLKA